LLEELKHMPFTAVWDKWCLSQGVPTGMDVIAEIKAYEQRELSQRS
jgi:L-rhamnose isomerase